jgi:hypothetical protein
MSATIMRIMASSSTRNTDPPGGRAIVIAGFLAKPVRSGAHPETDSQKPVHNAISTLTLSRAIEDQDLPSSSTGTTI